jgi:beta-carotene ketolase (CrtW type)
MKDFARQTLIGLLLAGVLLAAWIALHVFAVWRLDALAHPWVALACLFGLTWLSAGLFIVAHDAMHGSLAPSWPKVNAAAGSLALLLYAGFSFKRIKVKHRMHHLAPGTDHDPDFARAGPLSWYLAFMARYFGWREFLNLAGARPDAQAPLPDRHPTFHLRSLQRPGGGHPTNRHQPFV